MAATCTRRRVELLFLVSVPLVFSIPSPAHGRDSLIALMAADVQRSNVVSTIAGLEGFGTRYAFTSSCDAAGDSLHATLASYGLDVSYEDFVWGGKAMRNVVARLPGTVSPQKVFVLGAHYDSISQNPSVSAPGADDDASGIAAVLEAARIMSGHAFENTVEFICFSGEEQGMKGSEASVALALSQGKNIAGMVNLDMIAYFPASSDRELDIGRNAASGWLADVVAQSAADYASLAVHNWPDTGVCYDDQASYWNAGFPAVILMDCYEAHLDPTGTGETVPHYHRTTDTSATLDLDEATEAVRTVVGTMATLAVPVVTPITLYAVKDTAGNAVTLSWTGGAPNFDADVCPLRDFSSGVSRLTPTGGITATLWSHPGVLGDGVLYYYQVSRQ